MYRFGIFWWVWCWYFTLSAQTPAYLHYSVRDGLPGNLVYCGLQDSRGLLWFGTDKGLACFDGIRFHTYGVADGLPDPEVLEMQEDSRGRLWLSCFRKKPCYLLNGRIITEKQDSLLAKLDFITGTYIVSEDSLGGFWFTELTSKTYYSKGDTFYQVKFPLNVMRVENIGGDLLALGLRSVMRYEPEHQRISILKDMNEKTNVHSAGRSGNRILFAYSAALRLLEWQNGQIRDVQQRVHPAGKVFVDRLGRFWVCSFGYGVTLFDNNQRDLSNPVNFLPGKKVTHVFEDKQGTLWFGTYDEGIYALQQNAPLLFGHEAGFPSLNIRSLSRNAAGQLLVGDDAGNVHILQGNKILQSVVTGAEDNFNLVRQTIPVGIYACWVASD